MRNRRHDNDEPEPCPCNDTCRCHKKQERSLWDDVLTYGAAIIGFGTLLAFPFIMFYIGKNYPAAPPHIQVDGQDCIIRYTNEHCTLTGACESQAIAVCPEGK